MSAKEKHVVVERVTQVISAYSGPLPHPDHLRQYESIKPGFAERIFARMEAEQKHRHRIELDEAQVDNRNATIGLFLGFVVSVALIGSAIYCATIGATAIGVALVGASALGLVRTLGSGSRSSKNQGSLQREEDAD
jgi:uncharacterized membrane protein